MRIAGLYGKITWYQNDTKVAWKGQKKNNLRKIIVKINSKKQTNLARGRLNRTFWGRGDPHMHIQTPH